MEFRKIPSLDNLYEINEDGTIFRNIKTKRELKIKLDTHHSKSGYFTTFIHIGGRRPDAYIKRIIIHRAVAECWLGECPEGMEVDHIDRNSQNNHYSNLRYVTKSEQMQNRDHSKISEKGRQNLEESRRKRMKQVITNKDGVKNKYDSISECARELGKMLQINSEIVRYHLRRREPNYFGYQLEYGE